LWCILYLSRNEKNSRTKSVHGPFINKQNAERWIAQDIEDNIDSQDNYEVVPFEMTNKPRRE
jgi:hypothetical protein